MSPLCSKGLSLSTQECFYNGARQNQPGGCIFALAACAVVSGGRPIRFCDLSDRSYQMVVRHSRDMEEQGELALYKRLCNQSLGEKCPLIKLEFY